MPSVERPLPSSSADAGGQQDNVETDKSGPPILKGYAPMLDILNRKVELGSLINVVGLVKDCRLPFQSKGTDYKMTIKLFDKSLEMECSCISVNLFRPKEQMPVVGAGDVVLLQSIRVQQYWDEWSLITHHNTRLYVYSASKMPAASKPAGPALVPSAWDNKGKVPTPREQEYVSWLYHSIDKSEVPTTIEFESRANESLNVQDKFSLLKGVAEGRFYNLMVKAVHINESGGLVSVWVTDYSENPLFQDFPQPDPTGKKVEQVGDPNGYLSKYATKASGSKMMSDWKGPFGKMTMQITLFEPHAEYIRSYVRVGHWMYLRNVQVKTGRNGLCLEGFLREDRSFPDRIGVERRDPQDEDPENVDPRLKDAIRRMRDYTRENKMAAAKRKAGGNEAPAAKESMSKKRRKAERAAKNLTVRQQEQERLQQKKLQQQLKRQRKQGRLPNHQGQEEETGEEDEVDGADEADETDEAGSERPQRPAAPQVPDVNPRIISERQDEQVTPLATVLGPMYGEMKTDSGETVRVPLPFVNAKFRTQAHVVDFSPARLEDFSVARRRTELDILSDYEDGDDEDDNDEPLPLIRGDSSDAIWEWRFALLLEDATALPGSEGDARARVWAVVDNAEAQMLTGLNACDLRCDTKTQDELREKLFVLWGNLEQVKRQELRNKRAAQVAAQKAAMLAAEAERQRKRKEQERQRKEQERQKQLLQRQAAKWQPPPSSSDDEWQGQNSRSAGPDRQQPGQETNPVQPSEPVQAKPEGRPQPQKVSNQPFACCIREYGIRMPTRAMTSAAAETDDDNDDGDRKTVWQRMFGLFGTKISNA